LRGRRRIRRHAAELRGVCLREARSVGKPKVPGRLLGAFEQRWGDVRKHDRSGRSDALQGFKTDQPIATAEVEQRHPVQLPSRAQDPIADGRQPVKPHPTLTIVAGIASLAKPLTPSIRRSHTQK
jgi:hypothetical protein